MYLVCVHTCIHVEFSFGKKAQTVILPVSLPISKSAETIIYIMAVLLCGMSQVLQAEVSSFKE